MHQSLRENCYQSRHYKTSHNIGIQASGKIITHYYKQSLRLISCSRSTNHWSWHKFSHKLIEWSKYSLIRIWSHDHAIQDNQAFLLYLMRNHNERLMSISINHWCIYVWRSIKGLKQTKSNQLYFILFQNPINPYLIWMVLFTWAQHDWRLRLTFPPTILL